MRTILAITTILLASLAASASSLYIGNDTQTPVTVYTSGGTFVQFFGQDFATGSAINNAGNIWTVAPSFGDNQIVEYTAGQTVVNSFVATVNGGWVEDMSHGLGNTLYLGTFEGELFAVNDQTGAILSSFTVPNSSFTGVAFDPNTGDLWLSGGLASDNIFSYTTGGTLLNTISVSTTCGGLGYDSTDNSLWCGDFGSVHHYSLGGTLLGSFTTSSGAYHDGLETPNFGQTTVPEPSSLLLLGTSLLSFLAVSRRRK